MSDSVIIRRRVRRDFTTLPNDVIRDPRLSWKATGLLVYVLSLPEDFRLNLRYLTKLKPTGRDGTRAGLKELETTGYLKIRKQRNAGRFACVIWEVTDSPVTSASGGTVTVTENPNTVTGAELTNPVFPNAEKPTLPSTGSNQELIPTTTGDTGNEPEVVVGHHDKLNWPTLLGGAAQTSAAKVLQDCPHADRQNVLDEIAGLADRGSVRHPIGLLRKLVERAKLGQFVPAAALEHQRKRQSAAKAIQTRAEEELHRQQQLTPHAREAARKGLALARRQLSGQPTQLDARESA